VNLMTQLDSTTVSNRPFEKPASQNGDAEIAQAGFALLRELEMSLRASQKALLSRDVARLEQSTHQQIGLRRALEILWPGNGRGSSEMHCDPPLASELRTAQMRVLHLGRVQAALLRREQRWLRTLSNLLAGPEANYLPPDCPPLPPPHQHTPEVQEGNSCRA
jgi:hypothetical protein